MNQLEPNKREFTIEAIIMMIMIACIIILILGYLFNSFINLPSEFYIIITGVFVIATAVWINEDDDHEDHNDKNFKTLVNS